MYIAVDVAGSAFPTTVHHPNMIRSYMPLRTAVSTKLPRVPHLGSLQRCFLRRTSSPARKGHQIRRALKPRCTRHWKPVRCREGLIRSGQSGIYVDAEIVDGNGSRKLYEIISRVAELSAHLSDRARI